MGFPGSFNQPGVFVVEHDAPVRVLPATSTFGAIVGRSLRGRTDKARLVSNWNDFTKTFGALPALPTASPNGTLAAFFHFLNGGGPVYFVRVVGTDGVGATLSDLKDHANVANALDVLAQSVGTWGNNTSVKTEKFETENLAIEIAGLDAAAPQAVVDLKSLKSVEVGDVIDFVDEAGAAAGYGVVGGVIVDSANYSQLVAGRVYALIADGTKINGGAGVDAPAFKFRSASRHRAVTTTTEEAAANAQQLKLTSVEGLKIGSFVSAFLVAFCTDDQTRSKKIEGHGRVKAISGKTITLENATGLKNHADAAINVVLPVDVKAFAKTTWTNAGNTEGFSVVSAVVGSGGNAVSYEVILGGALAIAVVGSHIKITVNNGVTLANALAAAINANADAAKLVTATAITDVAGGDAVVNLAIAKRFLTGGAYTQVVSQEFHLEIAEGGSTAEKHEFLTTVSTSEDWIENRLGGTRSPLKPSDDNQSDRLMILRDQAVVADSDLIEKFPRSFKDSLLAGGVDDSSSLSDVEALGVSTQGSETGIYTLEAKEDFDWLAIPGQSGAKILQDGSAFAERKKLVFLMDTPQSDTSLDAIINFVQGEVALDTSYAALYAPWVKVPDPRDSTKLLTLPPLCGFVTSDWSAVARASGVHVSPANRSWRGPVDLDVKFTDGDRDVLTAMGVNFVRHLPGLGFRSYLARTLFKADIRRFVSVRRWLNYVSRSLTTSLVSLTFKPANLSLMREIQSAISDFLEQEWSKGALFGTREQAFNVKCDEETTSQADLDGGKIFCETRVSPVTPAESVIIGITSEAGGISIVEAVS